MHDLAGPFAVVCVLELLYFAWVEIILCKLYFTDDSEGSVECDNTFEVGVAPLVHEALHSVRDRGRVGGLASKGLLREEVVEGGGNGV